MAGRKTIGPDEVHRGVPLWGSLFAARYAEQCAWHAEHSHGPYDAEHFARVASDFADAAVIALAHVRNDQ